MADANWNVLAQAAADLKDASPQIPGITILDRVLGSLVAAPPAMDHAVAHPESALGGLIAEAFDQAMTPKEWADWAGCGSELSLREALMTVWTNEILPRFTERYGIAVRSA